MINRTDPDFAVKFCQGYFNIGKAVVDVMRSEAGAKILYNLWQDLGDQIYESRLYLLREELFRSGSDMAEDHRMPEFFQSLPRNGVILDYGCGTAEYARSDWYDKGGRGHLFDVSKLLTNYLASKYPGILPKGSRKEESYVRNMVFLKKPASIKYDGIICLDVLEHLTNPIETTEYLHSVLKPGGQALFFFCPGRTIAGHLDESIDQIPDWMEWVFTHFSLVKEQNGLLWMQKV